MEKIITFQASLTVPTHAISILSVQGFIASKESVRTGVLEACLQHPRPVTLATASRVVPRQRLLITTTTVEVVVTSVRIAMPCLGTMWHRASALADGLKCGRTAILRTMEKTITSAVSKIAPTRVTNTASVQGSTRRMASARIGAQVRSLPDRQPVIAATPSEDSQMVMITKFAR